VKSAGVAVEKVLGEWAVVKEHGVKARVAADNRSARTGAKRR
jgi:hypothetical protein